MVLDMNQRGEIDWIPNERCIATETGKENALEIQLQMVRRSSSISFH